MSNPQTPNPLTVVLSQTNSKNPVKRQLEEDLAKALADNDGRRVIVVRNLYDLKPGGETIRTLNAIDDDFVVVAWMFERAAHWILDRNDVRGHVGEVHLTRPDDEDEEDDVLDDADAEQAEKARVIDDREIPDRTIYCLDMRLSETPQAFVDEITRIAETRGTASSPLESPPLEATPPADSSKADSPAAGEGGVFPLDQWLQGNASSNQLQRFEKPTNDTAVGLNHHSGNGNGNGSDHRNGGGSVAGGLRVIDENTQRRWYPVIDFSRCTNCMECIDFCLFGVYGVDSVDTILVEQPDNCRKGCPACSRVCPENAIIFPQHKTPTIAGAPAQDGGLKIDLSLLFGAPDARDLAAVERDEQLVLAGRGPVGAEDELQKRQTEAAKPKDELDDLIDGLDDLDI